MENDIQTKLTDLITKLQRQAMQMITDVNVDEHACGYVSCLEDVSTELSKIVNP
jgi:hypothetical protein